MPLPYEYIYEAELETKGWARLRLKQGAPRNQSQVEKLRAQVSDDARRLAKLYGEASKKHARPAHLKVNCIAPATKKLPHLSHLSRFPHLPPHV